MESGLVENLNVASKWLNDNQGVVSVALFLVALALGWAGGVFSALRQRPRLRLSLIDGPTFCCTFLTGRKQGSYDVHRTGIALYLNVSNIGSAATSIEGISVGYHWHIHAFSLQWMRYRIGWHWLEHQTIAVEDFQVQIGDRIKVYPFLRQASVLNRSPPSTFLEVGRSANGVVYFEQPDSWGGCFPSTTAGKVRVKVRVRDTFGRQHVQKFLVPAMDIAEARRFNPGFGRTLSSLRGETLPVDLKA